MKRPQVRLIEPQIIESERVVTGIEAEELLRKYGYTQQFSTRVEPSKDPNKDLTFEELIKREKEKIKRNRELEIAKKNGPKPITYDGKNGYDTKISYGTDNDSGIGFKIEITSDMKLPKY